MKVKLTNVRLSYPALYTARPSSQEAGAKLRYDASFLIPKGDPQIKVVEQAILAEAKRVFEDKAKGLLASFKTNPQKYFLADGDVAVDSKGELKAPGYWVISSHRREEDGPPTVLDRDKTVLTKNIGRPYAGCFVNASIDVWAQKGNNAGMRCGLLGVQFAKDGDSFGGAPQAASPDEFDSLAEEMDDDFGDAA